MTAYNNYIHAKADSVGFAYWDPNTAFVTLRGAGAIPALPDFTSPQPFGTFISLDGIHPSGAAHVLVANALIDVINAKYQSTIPKITVAPPPPPVIATR